MTLKYVVARHRIQEGCWFEGRDHGQGSGPWIGEEIKGAMKVVAGKAVGDAKLESEGNADKLEGKVQNAIGGIKDTLRGK